MILWISPISFLYKPLFIYIKSPTYIFISFLSLYVNIHYLSLYGTNFIYGFVILKNPSTAYLTYPKLYASTNIHPFIPSIATAEHILILYGVFLSAKNFSINPIDNYFSLPFLHVTIYKLGSSIVYSYSI